MAEEVCFRGFAASMAPENADFSENGGNAALHRERPVVARNGRLRFAFPCGENVPVYLLCLDRTVCFRLAQLNKPRKNLFGVLVG